MGGNALAVEVSEFFGILPHSTSLRVRMTAETCRGKGNSKLQLQLQLQGQTDSSAALRNDNNKERLEKRQRSLGRNDPLVK
jgi:hypothetical protein